MLFSCTEWCIQSLGSIFAWSKRGSRELLACSTLLWWLFHPSLLGESREEPEYSVYFLVILGSGCAVVSRTRAMRLSHHTQHWWGHTCVHFGALTTRRWDAGECPEKDNGAGEGSGVHILGGSWGLSWRKSSRFRKNLTALYNCLRGDCS